MTEDARFADADADPRPLALRAEDQADLRIVSALVQDAILPASEIGYDPKARRLALLVNRFRWEDAERARAEGRDYERVRALLVLHDVVSLRSDGVSRDADTVLELLALDWRPGEDGTGRLSLEFAGDGTLAAEVECINVELRDVTRPYRAVSGRAPAHPG